MFPLPDRAAVTSFRMKVADRVIEADLKERAQAREDYEKAIKAGHRAAIAEEDRSGVFSLRVGNIPAQEQVSVELTLVGPLPVTAGEATFRFPLVVAPRYVAGRPLDGSPVGSGWGLDTDEVPDASRVTPPVLLPGFPNPVRLSLVVEIDSAGLLSTGDDWAAQIRSSLHSVIQDDGPPLTVRLQPGERLNRDFILRFPVAAETIQTTLLRSPASDGQPGKFMLMVVPPSPPEGERPTPRDVVVILDRSGSMGGWKMVAARRAAGRIVDALLDQDRFTIVAFDNEVSHPPHAEERLVEATDRNRWRALEWLGKIEARGGTEMGSALHSAFGFLADAGTQRQKVIVLVTDGQVAGEDALLKRLKKSGTLARIHAIGIDQAVNAGFLRRLADLRGGTCDLVESEDRLDEAMEAIQRTIGTPVLTGLRLEPLGTACVPDSIVPARLPDLFPDRPVMIFGSVAGNAGEFRIRMEAARPSGAPWEAEVVGRPGPADVLLNLWGRAKVRELEDLYASGTNRDPDSLARQIVVVSLSAHVLCRFTAYVAVDRSEVVNKGGRQQAIIQPVEAPADWEMFSEHVRACRLPLCDSLAFSVDASIRMRSPDLTRRVRQAVSSLIGREESLSPGRRGVSDIAADLRTVTEELERSLARRPKWRLWDKLVKLLDELTTTLVSAHDPRATEAARLLLRSREIASTVAKKAIDLDKVREHLGLLTAMLDSIGSGPAPEPGRKEFWM